MDISGLVFSIVPLAIQLVQYLQNVQDAPESRKALIEHFNLYIKYAQQVADRKKNNQISDKVQQSLEQQRVVLERLHAILQDPKLQKFLRQPAITVEAQRSAIIEDQTSITIDITDASSIISTGGSTIISDLGVDAASGTRSLNAPGIRRRRKRDFIKKLIPFPTLGFRTGSKESRSDLSSINGLDVPQSRTGSKSFQSFFTSTVAAEKSSTIRTLVNRWIWPFQEDEFEELLQLLEKITSILQKMQQLEHMETSFDILHKVTDIDNSVGIVSNDVGEVRKVAVEARTVVVKMHHKLEGDFRGKAYEWLSPLTFWSVQDNLYANLKPGTGTWLLRDEKFTKWFQGEFQALFCYGMPGAGKTTLTSLVIKYLKDQCCSNKPVGLAFLYCNYGDRQVQTLPNLLGSILRQLEKQCYITPDISKLYTEYWEQEQRFLPINEVLDRIKKCASALENVFLVVDALDECPHQHELLRIHLFDLIHSCSNIQLFTTSRPNCGTGKFFTEKGCSSLEIRAKDSDVRLYLNERIEGFSKTGENLYNLVCADRELWNEVIERILEQASGMFLIAQLHIAFIANTHSRKKLKEALSHLPKGLECTYRDTILRIKEQNLEFWKTIQKAFLLVTFTLDWLEPEALLDAVATHEDSGFDKDDRVEKAYLLSHCGGLLIEEEHRDPAQNKANRFIVRFIHHTAREFFEKHPDLLFSGTHKPTSPTELIAEVHSMITLVCLTYLTMDRGKAYQDAKWDGKNLSGDFPFLSYSFCYWGVHASKGSKDCIKNKLYEYFRRESSAGYPKGLPYYQIFSTFWEFDNYPSLRDSTLGQHIHAASGCGSVFVAAVVFDLRALVKGFILRDRNFIPSLPESSLRLCLTATAWSGNVDILKRLWVTAKDINISSIEDTIGSCMRNITPLWAAAYNGHGKVVELLLANQKVDINIADKDGWTPLHTAAGQGHDNVVELLLSDGRVDVNLASVNGWTPLNTATWNGHEKVVELLLADNRVDVNMASKDDCTPLHAAAQQGHDKVVELLLADNRVEVNKADKNGWTPLYTAARRGQDKVIELLLGEERLDVNIAANDGWTPLNTAAWNGRDKAVKMLLADNRVDVNMASKENCTPLHAAAQQGHEKVVELLLADERVEVNMADKDGWTPLHTAARQGHAKVVELLLADGRVDFNLVSQTTLSPLLNDAMIKCHRLTQTTHSMPPPPPCREPRHIPKPRITPNRFYE